MMIRMRPGQVKSTCCSQPYGIVFTNAACYSESAAKPNTIVRFDPKMEKFQTWATPGGDIVRNMDVDRDDNPANAVLAEQSRRSP
jgi:virginiamycin B lyase